MTPYERDRIIRSLKHAYLSRPDIAAWLALADLYTETCDGGLTCQCGNLLTPDTCQTLSTLWRARGTYYERILAVPGKLRELSHGNAQINLTIGGALILFSLIGPRRQDISVIVCKRYSDNWAYRLTPSYRWLLNHDEPTYYYTRRILQLIDDNLDLLTEER